MKRKRFLTLLILLMLAFIWGNSLLSREVSGRISDGIMDRMNASAEKIGLKEDLFTSMKDTDGDGVAEPSSHWIRKAAHVTEFAVLAALLTLRLNTGRKKRFPIAFLSATAVGAADELIQIFSHRGSQLGDVGIDAAGALLGVLLIWLITIIYNNEGDRRAE